MQRYIHLNAHPYLYSYPQEEHRIKNLEHIDLYLYDQLRFPLLEIR